MAAAIVCAPGTEYGPCVDLCSHRDCAASRSQATAPCVTCGGPIGYDTRWYSTEAGPEHMRCAHEAEDRRRAP